MVSNGRSHGLSCWWLETGIYGNVESVEPTTRVEMMSMEKSKVQCSSRFFCLEIVLPAE